MSTWTSHAVIHGRPDDILAVLTDPSAASRWAPVEFDCTEAGKLSEGSQIDLRGRLGGLCVHFEVDVHRADAERLELTASGPVLMHVEYRMTAVDEQSELEALVSVRRAPGLLNAVVARAADALFAAGALRAAVSGIAREVEDAVGQRAAA